MLKCRSKLNRLVIVANYVNVNYEFKIIYFHILNTFRDIQDILLSKFEQLIKCKLEI